MTQESDPGSENIRRPHGFAEERSLRFRARPELDEAFAAIVEQFGHEGPINAPEQSDDIQPLLDSISKRGLRETAEILRDAFKLRLETGEFEPASSGNVIAYLASVRLSPPIKITDIGSVDEDLINQLHLSQGRYIDEIQELLTFLDEDRDQVSVLELPAIRQKMLEKELEATSQMIIYKVIDEHGIAVVFDTNDQKAWTDMGRLVEDLSHETLSDISKTLREKKSAGGRTLIRDVIDLIQDRYSMRERAFELAKSNAETPPVVRQRVLESLSPHMRRLVERYFEDIDAVREATQ